jgi:hypothetical protein
MNTKNFLIATIKVPVKVNSDGKIITMDDYADISVEPLTTEPTKSFNSIYTKIIEYIHKNPEYLTSIVHDEEETPIEDTYEEEERDIEDPPAHVEESILHRFTYFKKSKKPLNISFRNKGIKHNFTKKNYE